MNIHDYTGTPYNFRSYNCWHHVRQVRRDAGLSTPLFDVTSPTAINAAFDAGHADTKGLVQVYEPRNFDAVLLGERHGDRTIWHAGVYYDGMISHCELAARQVRLEYIGDITERYTRVEFWR